jgi:hypothetical protein
VWSYGKVVCYRIFICQTLSFAFTIVRCCNLLLGYPLSMIVMKRLNLTSSMLNLCRSSCLLKSAELMKNSGCPLVNSAISKILKSLNIQLTTRNNSKKIRQQRSTILQFFLTMLLLAPQHPCRAREQTVVKLCIYFRFCKNVSTWRAKFEGIRNYLSRIPNHVRTSREFICIFAFTIGEHVVKP